MFGDIDLGDGCRPVSELRLFRGDGLRNGKKLPAHHGFRFVSIGETEFDAAMDAYARFGKGRHEAALNMGDCYAYACARTNGATLLFKGQDFGKTDIAAAT